METSSCNLVFHSCRTEKRMGLRSRPLSGPAQSHDQILVRWPALFPPSWVRRAGTRGVLRPRHLSRSCGYRTRVPPSCGVATAHPAIPMEAPGRRRVSRQSGAATVTCISSKTWYVSPYWGISGGMWCGAVVASMPRCCAPAPWRQPSLGPARRRVISTRPLPGDRSR